MKTSFNFGEYRGNLSKEVKGLRGEGKKDEAKDALEKAKADIRYEISSELHRLEKEVGKDSSQKEETDESQESLPVNWERIDISEKIPEWIQLRIDLSRMYDLGKKIEFEKDIEIHFKIMRAYFAEEGKERCRLAFERLRDKYEPAGKEKQEGKEREHEYYHEIINALEKGNYEEVDYNLAYGEYAEVMKNKFDEFINEISDGKYLSTTTIDGTNYVKAYSHAIGGHNTENSEGYISAHTMGLARQFDIKSPILGSKVDRYASKNEAYPSQDGFVWVLSGSSSWFSIRRPLVLFTSENPAFRMALENNHKVKSNRGYLPKYFGDSTEKMINLNLPEKATEKGIQEGILTSEKPIWADFADEVIDLVRGEILQHKYK